MNVRHRRRGRGHQRSRPASPRPASTVAPAPDQTAGPSAARRKTVLVLEDNATIGGITAALLREEGYRALRAWDLREALRIARDRKPDLILLDLSLPYPTGVPVLHELKAQPETSQAPLLLVSANVLQLEPEQAQMLSECVSRPIDLDLFINAVRRGLGDPEHEVPVKNHSSTVDHYLGSW